MSINLFRFFGVEMAIASKMAIVSTAAIAVHFTRVTSGGGRDLLTKFRGSAMLGRVTNYCSIQNGGFRNRS